MCESVGRFILFVHYPEWNHERDLPDAAAITDTDLCSFGGTTQPIECTRFEIKRAANQPLSFEQEFRIVEVISNRLPAVGNPGMGSNHP